MHPSLFTCYISVRQVQGVHPGRRRQERGRERRRRQVQSEGNREPCDAQRAREVRHGRQGLCRWPAGKNPKDSDALCDFLSLSIT